MLTGRSIHKIFVEAANNASLNEAINKSNFVEDPKISMEVRNEIKSKLLKIKGIIRVEFIYNNSTLAIYGNTKIISNLSNISSDINNILRDIKDKFENKYSERKLYIYFDPYGSNGEKNDQLEYSIDISCKEVDTISDNIVDKKRNDIKKYYTLLQKELEKKGYRSSSNIKQLTTYNLSFNRDLIDSGWLVYNTTNKEFDKVFHDIINKICKDNNIDWRSIEYSDALDIVYFYTDDSDEGILYPD